MAATSPVGDLMQQFMVGARGGGVPPGSHGIPVVAEVRSLSSPQGAASGASSAPRYSSSPPVYGASLVPPMAGARQLAKLKRFMTSILQYAHDMSPEVGDKVQDLVVRVVNSSISPDDFHRQFQEVTNFPLRSFVLPFLKQNLSLLAKELLQVSGSGKLVSPGQRFVQQVQGSPRIAASLNILDKRPATVIDVDVVSSPPEERSSSMDTKDRSADALTKAMDSLAPPPKKPRLVGDTTPGRDPQSPITSVSVGGLRGTISGSVRSQSGMPGSLTNGAADVGISLTAGKLLEPPDLGNKHADDWQHVDTMLQCVMGMVDRTKRAVAVLQQRAQLDRDEVIGWARQQVNNAELEVKRKAGEVMAKAMKQAEESVQEVKKRAEEAVADVKRTAVVELQKAVTAAEGRHKEAMAALQAQMDNGIAEARRHAAEEAFELANQQEESAENCWNCGRKASETCSGCNVARYCGSFCQHKDWDNHHHVCGQGLPTTGPDAAGDADNPTLDDTDGKDPTDDTDATVAEEGGIEETGGTTDAVSSSEGQTHPVDEFPAQS